MGGRISLSFGQHPKALSLTSLRRPRKQIGGLCLPLLEAGARKHFAFCRSGGKIYNTNASDYEIYFTPKYYKFNYLALKKMLEDHGVSSKVGGSAVWCTLRRDMLFASGRAVSVVV